MNIKITDLYGTKTTPSRGERNCSMTLEFEDGARLELSYYLGEARYGEPWRALRRDNGEDARAIFSRLGDTIEARKAACDKLYKLAVKADDFPFSATL